VIYRQFSITIVAAMALSVFVALTLTPALCATLLKPIEKGHHAAHDGPPRRGLLGLSDRFFAWFNRSFDRTANRYQRAVGGLLRRGLRMVFIYLAILAGVALLFKALPTSFLPNEDQGFVTASITLPSGATDERLGGVLN